MRQSVFEGDAVGGADLGIFIYLLALIILIGTLRSSRSVCRHLQLHSRFILLTGATIGVGLGHGMKLCLGRARPEAVMQTPSLFSPWYTFGPYIPLRDHFSGSMPSGHTAALLALVSCGYILCYHRATTRYRVLGGVLIGAGLCCAGVMGITCSMLLQHWVSDWLFVLFAGWLAIHYNFHYFHNVPARAAQIHGGGELALMEGGKDRILRHPLPWIVLLSVVVCGVRYFWSA